MSSPSRQEAAHTSSTGAPPVPVVAATSVEVGCTSTSISMRVFAIAEHRGASAPAVGMKLKDDGQVWAEKIHMLTPQSTVSIHACMHTSCQHRVTCPHALSLSLITSHHFFIPPLPRHDLTISQLNFKSRGVRRTDRRA